MTIDPSAAVAPGLFVFRCVATIALFVPYEDQHADGSKSRSTHYCRSYSITAESYSAATRILEELAGRVPGDSREPDGWLDQLELALADPSIGADSEQRIGDRNARGVHYVSGQLFYDEAEPEN